MMKFEYGDTEDTWRFQEPPYLHPEWQETLNGIAGLNRFGNPNLKIVWGGTERSDITVTGTELKYHCGFSPNEVSGYEYTENGETKFTTVLEGIPEHVFVVPAFRCEELGLMRWIVERWVSPEELERQGRFQQRYAPGEIEPTLRAFPRQGIYETYFIVETHDQKFRDVDTVVFDFLRVRWYAEHTQSVEELEAQRQAHLAAEQAKKTAAHEEKLEAIRNHDWKLPKEEFEARDEFWAKYHENFDAGIVQYLREKQEAEQEANRRLATV